MSNTSMSPKQKGLIGLGAMAVLSAATIWGTEPLYKFIDNFGKEAIYTAGTYTGKAEGFGGEVVVELTVSTTSIESMKITGDGETPGIGTNAIEQLPGAIMGKGSTEVDAISGATITSDAIKTATDQALALARGEEIVVEETTTAEETTQASASYSFTPGTYTATAKGYGGDVKVEVTVSDTAIVEIKADGADETPEIGGNAFKKLPAKMVEAQSADVDAISGATVTSDAVKEAVKAALAQAEGGEASGKTTAGAVLSFVPGTYSATAAGYGGDVKVEVTVSENAIVEVKADGADETPEIGGNAFKKLPAKIVEAQSADVDGVSGATITSDAVKEAVKAALAQAEGEASGESTESAALSFVPGTYSASSAGYGGDVKVEVTVSENAIVEVKADGGDETPEIGGNALKKLPAKIVEAQSADVDGVSGATVTGDALIAAVKDALTQAASTDTAVKEAPAAAGLKAGTFTGEAEGYAGKVTAEVIISDAGIADIKVKGDDETPEIGGNALKKLPAKMLEAQSAEVDAISGATITSDAIIDAVNQALEQARG